MSERRSDLKAVAAGDDVAARMPNGDIMQMTARMMDGWTQVNHRIVSLAQAQWRNTQSAAEEMRHCQSPKEMMDLQIKLARQAYDDYVDEAKRMGDLVTKISTEAMTYLGMPK